MIIYFSCTQVCEEWSPCNECRYLREWFQAVDRKTATLLIQMSSKNLGKSILGFKISVYSWGVYSGTGTVIGHFCGVQSFMLYLRYNSTNRPRSSQAYSVWFEMMYKI